MDDFDYDEDYDFHDIVSLLLHVDDDAEKEQDDDTSDYNLMIDSRRI